MWDAIPWWLWLLFLILVPFRTNSGQTLIFALLYATLLPVTKTRKTRSYKGFADCRRKPNACGIWLSRHSPDGCASTSAWLIVSRKWIVCSWPSTRKTKLQFLPIYIGLSRYISPWNYWFLRLLLFILVYPLICNLVLFWYCIKSKRAGCPALKIHLQFSAFPLL